jgi:tetratricopeptide (TPR) repeat protein
MAMMAILFAGLLAAPGAATLDEGLEFMKQGRYDRAIPVLEQENRLHPGTPDVLMNLGWSYWGLNKLDEAYRVASLLATLVPTDPNYLRLMATLEVQRKNFKQAEDLSRRALQAAPEDREARVVLAKALLGQDRKKEVADILDSLIHAGPQSPSVRFGMADLLAQIGRPQESMNYLDELLAADPGNPVYRRRRAQVLPDLGRMPEAVAEWERLASRKPPEPEDQLQLGWVYLGLNRPDDAGRLATLLVRLDPENPNFLRLSANIELGQRHFDVAQDHARRGLKSAPGDKGLSLVLAKAQAGLGQLNEAEGILNDLEREYPGDPAVLFEMSDILAQTGRREEALAIVDQLLRADSQNISYHERRAQVLYDLERVEEATIEWKALAERKPPDPKALLSLGWVYITAHMLDQAREAANLLVKLAPTEPAYLRLMANVEVECENYALGIKWAREALKYAPDDPETNVILARALIDYRQEDEGQRILDRLLRDHKDNVSVWYQLASLFVHQGKPRDSLVWYDKLVKMDPTKAAWRRQRAEALYQAGRFQEALAEWQALGRQNPPDIRSLHRLADDAFNRQAWKEFLVRVADLAAAEPLDAVSVNRIVAANQKLGYFDRAVNAADRYIKLEPVSLNGHFTKAEILDEMGDWESSRKVYEYALSRNPRSRHALDGVALTAAEQGRYSDALRMLDQEQKDYPSPRGNPYVLIRKATYLAESGQVAAALDMLEDFTKRRPTQIPALLYHGISEIDRSDSPSIATFRAQMKALKKAGYHSIFISELIPALREGKPLPKKPILITFDDGRADSFRNGDPVLAEVGFKANMFVIGQALTLSLFHASEETIRRFRATGRWELHAHSDKSHDPQPVDAEGHTECVLPTANGSRQRREWRPRKSTRRASRGTIFP